MKEITLSILIILSFMTQFALANGVDHNPNQSAEYVKTLNRNASIDADSVYYNPAGTAIMEGGVHIYLSNQTIYRPIEMSKGPKTIEGEKSAYYFPNIYVIYNRNKTGPGNIAVSLGFLSMGGDDAFNYENGLQKVNEIIEANYGDPPASSDLRSISSFYSLQVNLAYSFLNNGLSFSAGYRFIHVMDQYVGKLKNSGAYDSEFDTELTGMSHGVILGLSSMPIKNLILATKFEWHLVMELESEANKEDALFNLIVPYLADGAKLYKIIPMNLAFGISYSISGIKMEFNFNYFLNEQTKWPGLSNNYDNGYETGFGIDYTLPMIPLNIGLGYLYTLTGGNELTRNEFHESLDSHSVGFGLSYNLMSTLKVTVSYSFTYFLKETMKDSGVEFSKMGHDVAIGLQFKAF